MDDGSCVIHSNNRIHAACGGRHSRRVLVAFQAAQVHLASKGRAGAVMAPDVSIVAGSLRGEQAQRDGLFGDPSGGIANR